jgi:8-oxo-dGTP pyrophosphatase MutT (NUDIX family)
MNEEKHGPYIVTDHKEVYKNPWTTFYEDAVIRPDGKLGVWGITNVGPGTAILALDKDHNVYLAKGYMYANNKEITVLPGGKIDGNESPLDCAKRELEEEIGLKSDTWIHLGTYHVYPAIIEDNTDMYLAMNATKHIASDPDQENFTLQVIPLEEAVRMAMNSEIFHCLAVQAIMQAWYYLQKQKSS